MSIKVKVSTKTRKNTKEEQDKNLERALKKFKKEVKDAGILKEIYDRMYFTKPSAIKREKNKRRKLKIYFDNLRN